MQKGKMRWILVIALLIIQQIESCFVVNFIHYGPLINYAFDRYVNFTHPYIFHYNQPITLPEDKVFTRNLSSIQKSDVKRMQLLYKHGGLYLDNDQLIDVECIKTYLCPIKTDKLYLLDWTDRDNKTWLQSVPISFIYAPKPNNPTLYKILTSYDQSANQTVDFSGPNYVQNFKKDIKFLKVNRSCEYHIGTKGYQTEKRAIQHQWIYKKYDQYKANKVMSDKQKVLWKQQRQFFNKLWKSGSVIYPLNFNITNFVTPDPQFNHIQIVNKDKLEFRVIQYSENQKNRKKIKEVQVFYKRNPPIIYQPDPIIQATKIQKKKQQKIKIIPQQQNITKILKVKKKQKQSLFDLQTTSMDSKPFFSEPVVTKILEIIFVMLTALIGYDLLLKTNKKIKTKKSKVYKQIENGEQSPNTRATSQSIIEIDSIKLEQQTSQQLKSQKIFKDKQKTQKIVYWGLILILYAGVALWLFSGKNQKVKSVNQTNEIIETSDQFASDKSELIQIKSIQKSKRNKTYKQLYGIQWYPPVKEPFNYVSLKQLGIYNLIQIDSRFDYMNLKNRKQFFDFKHFYEDTIGYDLYKFQYNASLEKKKQLMKYTQFVTNQQMDYELQNIEKWGDRPKVQVGNTQVYLASYLVYNMSTVKFKQLEYYYYDKKYNLSSIDNQIHICVISTGYQVYSKDKYKKFFQSIEQQNYTNFSIVVVDDNSPDLSAYHFYQYLNKTNFRSKNKVKIIKNHDKLGALGNMYVYVKKFCPKDSIVVNMDTDDWLIGYQAFNVLNSVYQDPQVWYVYTRYFLQIVPKVQPHFGQYSLPLTVSASDYRLAKEWNTSHLRTYRQQVMARVPIEQYIQYYYDNETNLLVPRFYPTCADRYQVYTHLELVGDKHYKFLQDPFYFYDESGTHAPCRYQYVHYGEYQSRTKRIMKPLDSLDGPIQYFPDVPYSKQIMDNYKQFYKEYLKCLQVFNLKQTLK